MDVKIISNKFMIFTSPADELICGEELKKLVHKIQNNNRMPLWYNIHADIYSSRKENLYFVYPNELKIFLAEYAIPFLGEYFTD